MENTRGVSKKDNKGDGTMINRRSVKQTVLVWFTTTTSAMEKKPAVGVCYVTLHKNDTKESVFRKAFEKIKHDGHVTNRNQCTFSLLAEDETFFEEHLRLARERSIERD